MLCLSQDVKGNQRIKIIEKDKSKEKYPSHMYDDFHAHQLWPIWKLNSQTCIGHWRGCILTSTQRKHRRFLSLLNSYQCNLWMTWILPSIGGGYVPFNSFWVSFLMMQKIQNIVKILQINSNINSFVPICHQSWIEIFKLNSGCPVYHKCWWMWYLFLFMKKIYLERDLQVHSIFPLLMFPMVFLKFFSSIFQILWRTWHGWKKLIV